MIWNFNYEAEEITIKSPDDIDGILPNTPIKAKVTVDGIHYLGALSNNNEDRSLVLDCGDGLYVACLINSDEIQMWEAYQEDNKKVKIEAIVRNITSEAAGSEPIISKTVILSDLTIK